MKSIKIDDSTHEILKLIQYKDRCRNTPKSEQDFDAIIFKSLMLYALQSGYKMHEFLQIVEKYLN